MLLSWQVPRTGNPGINVWGRLAVYLSSSLLLSAVHPCGLPWACRTGSPGTAFQLDPRLPAPTPPNPAHRLSLPAAPLGFMAFSLATCLYMTSQAGITEASTQVRPSAWGQL